MARDSVVRRLAHEPLGWRPTTLLVTVRRYRCGGCGQVWRQDTSLAAQDLEMARSVLSGSQADLRRAGAETIVMGSLAFGAADLAARMAWVHAQALGQ